MKILVALGLLLGVFVVGNGLAVLPYTENDPCSTSYGGPGEGDMWSQEMHLSLAPLGWRCVNPPGETGAPESDMPGALAYVAWLAFAAAAWLLAAWRWTNAALRGGMCALLTLGVFGSIYTYFGEYAPSAMASFVLGTAIVFVVDLRGRGNPSATILFSLVVPVVANVVWFVPYAFDLSAAGVAAAAFAGALASFALDHVARPGPSGMQEPPPAHTLQG